MEKKNEFHTLTGYRNINDCSLTESMEDYLEMIVRLEQNGECITIKKISEALHVRPSSVSKMCRKLSNLNYLSFEKYGTVSLIEKGKTVGTYLFWRHSLLETLLKKINGENFYLEQVEKIEHFIDDITLCNLELFLKKFE